MGRIKFLPLLLLTAFLILMPQMECQVRPPVAARPLCLSQFALANHACAMLPINPHSPPPAPPSSPPPDEHRHGHGHGHNHGHRHKHRHRRHKTPIEEECCRWLEAVDAECVCEVLVHLPVFMARPSHEYTIAVGDVCNVSYSCGGRLRF